MRLGYCGRQTSAGPPCASFNEAEAHAPRIHAGLGPARARSRAASMRPRRMRLGYGTSLCGGGFRFFGLQ